jgi:tRNA(Glu) U13 pseudouridine synthase TruD
MSRIKDIEMARYLAGEMGVNEELAFLDKASRNQKQRSELINMEKHWKYYDQNPSAESWDTGKAWNQLYERLESEGLLDEKPVSASFPGTRRTLLRIAATVLSWWWLWESRPFTLE